MRFGCGFDCRSPLFSPDALIRGGWRPDTVAQGGPRARPGALACGRAVLVTGGDELTEFADRPLRHGRVLGDDEEAPEHGTKLQRRAVRPRDGSEKRR